MYTSNEKWDIYGFGLAGLSQSEIHIRGECLHKTQSALGVWMKTIRRKDLCWFEQVPVSGKLKSLIRRCGIPPELRPEIWMALSGAKGIRSQYPVEYYQTLLGPEIDVIDAETAALFRLNVHFGGKQGFNVVNRILGAYQRHRPGRIGSAPGVASIVAFLLLVIGREREEDVFWLFDSLLENKLLNNSQHEVRFLILCPA